MPTYIYFCEIHKEFETQQSIKDPPLEECPQCVKAGIVEYRCDACGVVWRLESPDIEIRVDGVECVNCGNFDTKSYVPKPKRLISKSNFILTGSGWSRDNYK